MAVVKKFGSAAFNPASPTVLEGVERAGHVKRLCSTLEIANGDSATSLVYFGSVPSNARLIGTSVLRFDGLTGITDFDLGGGQGATDYAALSAYTAKSADALVNGADLHTAGSVSAVSAVDIANLGKPLWSLLGYTSDPSGSIDIVGTLNTAATAAGTLTLELIFCTP